MLHNIHTAIRTCRSHPTLIVGSHLPVIQSMLDFDYLAGKTAPDIQAIITNTDGWIKLFWGRGEILIPTYASLQSCARAGKTDTIQWFVNVLSARRTLTTTAEVIAYCPQLIGGVIFAEGVTEAHALAIADMAIEKNLTIIGPATVGLLVPGHLKLGAIGGVDPSLWQSMEITRPGQVAIISGSGGMTGELISLTYQTGQAVSFALSFGGDRFPTYTPEQAFLLAESDPQTKNIVYYGELGGDDEYRLIELIKTGKVTKPIIAHIAGTVGELFPESPQFGHAKAKAHLVKEKASEKRKALAAAGVTVTERFSDVEQELTKLMAH